MKSDSENSKVDKPNANGEEPAAENVEEGEIEDTEEVLDLDLVKDVAELYEMIDELEEAVTRTADVDELSLSPPSPKKFKPDPNNTSSPLKAESEEEEEGEKVQPQEPVDETLQAGTSSSASEQAQSQAILKKVKEGKSMRPRCLIEYVLTGTGDVTGFLKVFQCDALSKFFTESHWCYGVSHLRVTNYKGESVLHVACRNGKEAVVAEILKFDLSVRDINLKDNAGWTPLHEAVQIGNIPIVRLLLKNGASPNVPGYNYITPLQKAVINGFSRIFYMLLNYGADREFKNYEGQTAMTLGVGRELNFLYVPTEAVPDHNRLFETIVNICYKDIAQFGLKKIRDFLKQHNNVVFTAVLHKNVTHFVVDDDDGEFYPTDENIYLAILWQIKIVRREWLTIALDVGDFIPEEAEENYIIHRLMNSPNYLGPSRAMHSWKLHLPRLFDGCQFYLMCDTPFQHLRNFIVKGGGRILDREPTPGTAKKGKYPYHARNTETMSECCTYVIFATDRDTPVRSYNMKEIKHLPALWLLLCIVTYKILSREEFYLLSLDFQCPEFVSCIRQQD